MCKKQISVLVKEEGEHQWLQKYISSLSDVQNICHGLVESISLPYNIDLWVNEEGTITSEYQINLLLMWDEDHRYHQLIFGPVLLTGVDSEGKMTSLNELQRKWVAKHLKIGQLKSGQFISVIDLTDRGAIA